MRFSCVDGFPAPVPALLPLLFSLWLPNARLRLLVGWITRVLVGWGAGLTQVPA